MRLNGTAKPKINEYKMNVEPPNCVPSALGCVHKILHVICSEPGNFSIVLAVIWMIEKKKKQFVSK